ncbi:hypothetical protein N7481_000869 [Penicillium waksmanii]|uniref:uncharacterized protein n=1 Tax=Penicillium waksmanii TaxID=69791 RepID=UPI002548E479|nr:uncharacterized protein N7481_000869 [Penicillium waksmanii]KAJ6000460.1 hypothetical protein N7481_000869 [Penicillium waksmanii]
MSAQGSGKASWNSHVWVNTPSAERTLLIVQSFFMLLLLVGLLIVSAGIYFLKKSRRDALKPMPVTTTLAAMFFMAGSQASTFAYNSVSFRAHYAKQTYNVAQLIGEFCSFISYCLLFHVLYAIIHIFAERVTKVSTKTLSAFKYVHWGAVSLFVVLCIVDWAYYVGAIDSEVKEKSSFAHRMDVWEKIDSVRWVVFCVSAWEIAGWAIFLGLMTSRDSSYIKFKHLFLTLGYQMSAFLFVAASGCFLGLNFLWFVWDILAFLQSSTVDFSESVTGPGKTARQIVVFVFFQGFSLGLLLCYWRFPAQEHQREDPELGSVRIDRTGLVLAEIERSKKPSRFVEQLTMESPAEADSTPCLKDRSTQAGCSELMAESDWNMDRKERLFEADSSKPILEADSIHVSKKQ